LAPQPATVEQQLQLLRDLPVLEFVRLCAEGIHGYARQLPSPQALMNDDGARAQFLEYCAARSSSRLELAEALLRDPPAFRHRLLTFLARCEAAFFARDWATVQDVIHRSATKTTAKLRADGAWKTLAGLSETARGREDLHDVRFDKLQQRSVALDGRELVLVPSVRIGPHLTIKDTPGYPVVVHFGAVEALDEGLGIRQVRDRLSALASETRMEILRHLSAEPITTSELALRLQQNPAQISRAIGVLRDAGLVQSERRGKLVYHRIDTARVLRLGPDIISTLVR
jgi:Predicted transcriptional regulators